MNENKKEKVLIINADDFGMCHATNQAIIELLDTRAVTSASLMLNVPWVNEAIAYWRRRPDADIGIHLTHTSEWDQYKWKPLLSEMSTLVDEQGHFFPDNHTLWKQADPEQLRKESRAQMELAYQLGLDPVNIDNHMGSLIMHMEIALDLCEQYMLPLRLPRELLPGQADPRHHRPLVEEADKRGIFLIDRVESLPFVWEQIPSDTNASQSSNPANRHATKDAALRILRGLAPGVTELILHPSKDGEELRAITDTAAVRQAEYEVFRDPEVQAVMREEGIKLGSWRALRTAQRAAAANRK